MAVVLSTIADFPLTIGMVLRRGLDVAGDSRVGAFDGTAVNWRRFDEIAERVARLAGCLRELGVRPGDRVATLCANSVAHLEAYFAVPAMGAVLHTANPRFSPAQLAYVLRDAAAEVVLVDPVFQQVLDAVREDLPHIRHVLCTEGEPYEALLAASEPSYPWPDVDERAASAICHTTGTTGEPKGVAYSHRGTVLHAFMHCGVDTLSVSGHDRILLLASMFHVNGWVLPYSGWFAGAELVLPGSHLQPPSLARLIEATRPTLAGAVPTVWNDLSFHAAAEGVDLSSFRMVLSGGAAVPPELVNRYARLHRVSLRQVWGMTENGLLALSEPDSLDQRQPTGRVVPGVEVRVVGEGGQLLARDGEASGELQVRGPWVTASYLGGRGAESFADGWLRTGDVGSVGPHGEVWVRDRAKDLIKSGGEWIVSLELEASISDHPDVADVAVVAVPDERWSERPLACVVPAPGTTPAPEDLRSFLRGRVPRWWVPERWALVAELPRTSVGKSDKRALREQAVADALPVVRLGPLPPDA